MRVFKRFAVVVPLVALAAILIGLPAVALGKDDSKNFSARLIGFNEVPSINTGGSATLKLTLSADTIDFTLAYHDLSLAPLVAHIHFGQARTNGGVMVFFCGGGGQAPCPATTSGTISGTIVAANVQAIAGQGITAGDLVAVERAIRGGAAYANMHTSNFKGGEIRGQIQRTDD
jgi:hypothetical protein